MLFIYENRSTGEIEVMESHEALDLNLRHGAEDWKFIGSLDPKEFIRLLLRDYPDLVRQLRQLKG